MTITITVFNSETGNGVMKLTFDNSIDANKERDILDSSGADYRVEWNC